MLPLKFKPIVYNFTNLGERLLLLDTIKLNNRKTSGNAEDTPIGKSITVTK